MYLFFSLYNLPIAPHASEQAFNTWALGYTYSDSSKLRWVIKRQGWNYSPSFHQCPMSDITHLNKRQSLLRHSFWLLDSSLPDGIPMICFTQAGIWESPLLSFPPKQSPRSGFIAWIPHPLNIYNCWPLASIPKMSWNHICWNQPKLVSAFLFPCPNTLPCELCEA